MRRESGDYHIRHKERRVPPGWLGVGLDLSGREWSYVAIGGLSRAQTHDGPSHIVRAEQIIG